MPYVTVPLSWSKSWLRKSGTHKCAAKLKAAIIESHISTGKKNRFFKVFKVPGKKCITTVSKENFKKKK